MGDQELAEKRSKETRQASIAGVLVGVLIIIINFIVYAVVIVPLEKAKAE